MESLYNISYKRHKVNRNKLIVCPQIFTNLVFDAYRWLQILYLCESLYRQCQHFSLLMYPVAANNELGYRFPLGTLNKILFHKTT